MYFNFSKVHFCKLNQKVIWFKENAIVLLSFIETTPRYLLNSMRNSFPTMITQIDIEIEYR